MKDTHVRSIVKAITWRIIASVTTMTAAFIITKSWTITLSVGAIDVTAKLIFYYLHERAWNSTKWGKIND